MVCIYFLFIGRYTQAHVFFFCFLQYLCLNVNDYSGQVVCTKCFEHTLESFRVCTPCYNKSNNNESTNGEKRIEKQTEHRKTIADNCNREQGGDNWKQPPKVRNPSVDSTTNVLSLASSNDSSNRGAESSSKKQLLLQSQPPPTTANGANKKKSPRGAVNRVEVSFTERAWNLAKEGMNKLLKEKDNISENIYSIISDINKNVFSKHIIFIDNDNDDHDDDQEKEEKKYLNTSTSYHVFDKVKVMFCLLFCFLVLLLLFLRTDCECKLGSIGDKILFKQVKPKFISIRVGRSLVRLFIN